MAIRRFNGAGLHQLRLKLLKVPKKVVHVYPTHFFPRIHHQIPSTTPSTTPLWLQFLGGKDVVHCFSHPPPYNKAVLFVSKDAPFTTWKTSFPGKCMQVAAIHRIHNRLMLQKSSDHQLIWKLSHWVKGFVSSPRSCSVWKNQSTIGRFTFLCLYWSSQLKEKGSTNKASYLKTSENPEKKGDPSRSKTRSNPLSPFLQSYRPPQPFGPIRLPTAREANRDWQYHQCLRWKKQRIKEIYIYYIPFWH